MNEKQTFPKDFLWGAATASYQIEGGIENNDWAQSARDGKVPVCGRACDSYNRYEEDFDIAKDLGHNAHRFSIEWSRIEPEEGRYDEQEIEHYRTVIQALRDRGIEPMITVWHWTVPQWFDDKGGWLHPDATKHFVQYASKLVSEFKDVRYWVIYNEPETRARHGYFLGDQPPHMKNPLKAYRVLRTLIDVYVETYKAMKKIAPDTQVGFSESVVYFEPYKNRLFHKLVMKAVKWWRNNPFLDTFVEHADIIGLQYYFHSRTRFNPWKSDWWLQYNDNERVTDFGWEIYPEGLYHNLKDLAKYNKPIIITENGLADAHDTYRGDFIREHLMWCKRAMQEGVDLRGYFYWSLLDNYEWARGYEMRFGLVEMNYDTLERTVRPSAYVYKEIIESNGANLT